jgi:hypothetical protein
MKNLNFGVITTLVVISILITTTFTSCKPKANPEKFSIRVIDSCEYIEYYDGYGKSEVYSITHKGNCKYCQLRNKSK